MGFTNITYEDINPYDRRFKRAREVIKLAEDLNDIDATVKDAEQDTSFIEPSERDKLLPLRELEQ